MQLGPKKVNYTSTSDVKTAESWLAGLSQHPMIATDFEAAIRYTTEEVAWLQKIATDEKQTYIERKRAQAVLDATPLDHPIHSTPTHLSVAWSDTDAFVIIIDSDDMLRVVMEFLVTTEIKQIWHNASYDFRHILFHTGRMPKCYEDTQIYTKTLINHVDVEKAKSGLKDLAGHVYGAWGLSSDNFTRDQMYDEKMLQYAATDACATFWVYECVKEFDDELDYIPSTNDPDYSPWDQLPMPTPKNAEYPEAYFYHYTAKHLVKDTVRIMDNGLPISLERVRELELTLEDILKGVLERLHNNEAVKSFLNVKQELLQESFVDVKKGKLRGVDDYLVSFDHKKPEHRSYFMHVFSERVGIKQPEDKLPTGIAKWSANAVKKLTNSYPPLNALLEGKYTDANPTVEAAMRLLAEHKAEAYNRKILDVIENTVVDVPRFNPGSANQKRELFEWLGIASESVSSKTGEDSWSREELEKLNKMTEDEDVRDITETFIDYSFAAIVKNNFVKAFYKYTVGDELHGQYKLLGAKSGRYTSSNPNMLNAPSSGSSFSKPVKRCFIAPKGYIVASIDYSALEDRVMANLSEDANKLAVFLKGVDGHSLAALFYWPEEAERILQLPLADMTQAAIKFFELVEAKNPDAKDLRSRGKRISFGLAYGCFPPKVAASAKIPLVEAEGIFYRYHNELYPQVTDYRENYVLKTAMAQGYIHLGMGFRLYSDNPSKDIRTLNNATCQFWSILTPLTINKLHQLIDAEGLGEDIKVTSTIYDSIYFIVKDNPKVIKWLNDRVVPIMEKDFMEGQILANSADLEIGPSWEQLYKLPHDATIEEIKEVRKEWS